MHQRYPVLMRPLHDTPQGILGCWFAEPLERGAAEQLLEAADSRQMRLARQRASCRVCRLMRMVAHFWLELDIEGEFERLAEEPCAGAHERILARQIYGQLLMSRRIAGAHEQLQTSFAAASDLYAPGDYFLTMRRNALLRHLPLSRQPHPPLGLQQLLITAAVAAQLQRSAPSYRPGPFDHSDTLG